MPQLLEQAFRGRWTPFFAIVVAAGLFALGVASLMPDPPDLTERINTRRQAAAASFAEERVDNFKPEAASSPPAKAKKKRPPTTLASSVRSAPLEKKRPHYERSEHDVDEPEAEPPEEPDAEPDDEPPVVKDKLHLSRSLGAKLNPRVLRSASVASRLKDVDAPENEEAANDDSDAK